MHQYVDFFQKRQFLIQYKTSNILENTKFLKDVKLSHHNHDNYTSELK